MRPSTKLGETLGIVTTRHNALPAAELNARISPVPNSIAGLTIPLAPMFVAGWLAGGVTRLCLLE